MLLLLSHEFSKFKILELISVLLSLLAQILLDTVKLSLEAFVPLDFKFKIFLNGSTRNFR